MKKIRSSTGTMRRHTHTPETIREILEESREKVRRYFLQRDSSLRPSCEVEPKKRRLLRREIKHR